MGVGAKGWVAGAVEARGGFTHALGAVGSRARGAGLFAVMISTQQ